MLRSFPYLIWRCGYMLLCGQRGKAAKRSLRIIFFTSFRFGWDQHAAGQGARQPVAPGADGGGLCRSILAGIKLLLLVALWKGAMQVIGAVVYGDPRSALTGCFRVTIWAFRDCSPRPAMSPRRCRIWLSLYLELIWECLFIAAKGHVWIGMIAAIRLQCLSQHL